VRLVRELARPRLQNHEPAALNLAGTTPGADWAFAARTFAAKLKLLIAESRDLAQGESDLATVGSHRHRLDFWVGAALGARFHHHFFSQQTPRGSRLGSLDVPDGYDAPLQNQRLAVGSEAPHRGRTPSRPERVIRYRPTFEDLP